MRIALLTAGTRGDVQPYIALARALARAGHAATVVAPRAFEPLAREYGVAFHPAGADEWPTPERLREAAGEMDGLSRKGNLALIRRVMEVFAQHMTRYTAEALPACEGAEAVGYGALTSFAALSIAEKLGIKYFAAMLQAAFPTRELPSPLFPPGPSWIPGYNRLSHWAADRIIWRMSRESALRLRREVLGLPPWEGWIFDTLRKAAPPVLVGVSPTVLPRPRDWEPYLHMTGYWFLDEPAGWTPPRALAEFLASGPAPVCVGFGSMPSTDPAADVRTIVTALARAGQRGIIFSGWAELHAHARELPPTVLAIDSAPHAWVFPRAAAVVHHGGAGTTGAAFRAGVPQVVVPVGTDQPFWAHRVAHLGAGPAPIPRKRLTVDRLAAAISRAVGDDGIRARAHDVGERVRTEDGATRAVEILERALVAA